MKSFLFLLPFWYPIKVMDYFVHNPQKLEIFSEPFVAYQTNQTISVHSDICPHQGASLSKGWLNKDGHLHCPYHGFEFCNGKFCKIPDPSNTKVKKFERGYQMKLYPNRLEKGILYVRDESQPLESSSIFYPPEEYNNTFTSVDGYIRFPTNYLQVMENLLDMLHISYVHSFGSSQTPLPKITNFEYLTPFHGRSTFTYQPNKRSISKVVGQVKSVIVENEFILPTNTITRVTAGDTIKTVFTRCIPISDNETVLYWKLYRNFWKNVIGDFVIRHLMRKTLDEDGFILRNVYPREKVEQKINTRYDKTITEFRKTFEIFKKN